MTVTKNYIDYNNNIKYWSQLHIINDNNKKTLITVKISNFVHNENKNISHNNKNIYYPQ